MKCVICHGEEVKLAEVIEEFETGDDIVRVPIQVPVCGGCGERYYDRATTRRLEKLRDRVEAHDIPLRTVGRVLLLDDEVAQAS